jgi:hypothetical protein
MGMLACKLASLLTMRGDIRQSRTAEPGPQLKPLLEHFPIILITGIFNGDSVITLADLAAILHFAFPLLWYIIKSRGGGGSETYLVTSSCRQQLV